MFSLSFRSLLYWNVPTCYKPDSFVSLFKVAEVTSSWIFSVQLSLIVYNRTLRTQVKICDVYPRVIAVLVFTPGRTVHALLVKALSRNRTPECSCESAYMKRECVRVVHRLWSGHPTMAASSGWPRVQ